MSAVNRTDTFAKIHKVLKKCYKPSAPVSGRSVMEYLLFACCLEDAHHDAAEEAFAALVHTFFDWNEVRVTSISELAEVMACLPDPRTAANRIKRVLHSVFEATFNFDLEDQRKKNLGPTVQWLQKLDGATPFVVSYVIQAALEGHSIPIDAGAMSLLRVLDVVTEKDATAGVVPGLERAVSKAKGVEFGSLLHEFGVDYAANPYSATMRDLMLQIDPDCAARLPKRRAARVHKPEPEKTAKAASLPTKPSAKPSEKPAAKLVEKSAEKPAEKTKPAKPVAKPIEKPAAAKKTPPAPAHVEPPKKKPVATPEAVKHPTKGKPVAKPAPAKKPSVAEGLSKRKPR